MTRDDRTPRGAADDERLLAALRRLGDAHEPDSAAIWARVDPATLDAHPDRLHPGRAGEDGDVPVISLDRRRDRDLRAGLGDVSRYRPRPVLLVPLAAAAVLGVLVVSQVVTRPDDVAVPTPAASPTALSPTPQSTGSPRPSPSATATPTGDALGTAVATTPRTRTRTVTVTVPAGPQQDGSKAPAPAAGDPAPASTSPSSSGLGVPAPTLTPLGVFSRGLSLSTPGSDDWVVLGARSDGAQVRAKRPTYPDAPLVVTPPSGVRVVRSPLAVSWADGLPEQSRVGATTWLAGGSGAAWTVTTQRLDVPRRLTIVGGGAPSGLRLAVEAPGRSARWTWAGNPAGSGPFSLSVVIPGGAGPVTVTLIPAGSDALAVSAVSARRI